MGVPVVKLAVNPDGSGDCDEAHSCHDPGDDIIADFAGGAADKYVGDRRHPASLHDWRRADEHGLLWESATGRAFNGKVKQWFIRQAEEFVLGHQIEIYTLAKALYRERVMDSAALARLLHGPTSCLSKYKGLYRCPADPPPPAPLRNPTRGGMSTRTRTHTAPVRVVTGAGGTDLYDPVEATLRKFGYRDVGDFLDQLADRHRETDRIRGAMA